MSASIQHNMMLQKSIQWDSEVIQWDSEKGHMTLFMTIFSFDMNSLTWLVEIPEDRGSLDDTKFSSVISKCFHHDNMSV